MENNQESKIAAAKRIAIIILLGAIGSGVWAGVGEPLFQISGNAAIRVVSWFSSTYLETMYAEIGKGLNERSAWSLHSSISGLFMGFWVVTPYLVYSRRKRLSNKITSISSKLKAFKTGDAVPISSDEDESPQKILDDAARFARKLNVFFWALAVAAPLAITLQLASLYMNLYTSATVIYVERSIEILSPHIDNATILRLRADYRAISSREQFILLHQKLGNYAKTKNIELPAFTPL